MALNVRSGHGSTLPVFREGSGLVQGLQSVGIPKEQNGNHGDNPYVTYVNVNKFENNWEDLDDEFSTKEIFDTKVSENVPVRTTAYDQTRPRQREETFYSKQDVPPVPVQVDPSNNWTWQPMHEHENLGQESSSLETYKIQSKPRQMEDTFYTEPSIPSVTNQSTSDWTQSVMKGQGYLEQEILGTTNLKKETPSDQSRYRNSDRFPFIKDESSADLTQPDSQGHGYFEQEKLPIDTADVTVESASNLRNRFGGKRFETHSTVGSADRSEGGSVGCCGYILWCLSILLIICTFPFSMCLSIKVVQEYERAVIFRLGRLVSGGAKGPGLFFIIPCIDSYTKVDMRTVSFDVPPQEILTKDSVTVAVDAVVYYRIQNAAMSITNVEDSNRSTRLLAATTLRNVLGTKNLSEILSDRETISHVMQGNLDECTDPWGIRVERVEIKDVRLPVQLQRAMAAEAEAAREARAKVIAAEGEQKASRALKEAADVMAESPAAIQLRYLQTLNTISAEKNSTIIFPLPIDLMQSFMRYTGGAKETTQAHF
ncbi:band 7 protein AAEL010189-like isoform X2 [Mytilus edulis]|uniref:band 7 protein AAEL010189-like isoform X2 n=1 Tax=Mytilus edulis TaxID=6550 RepID=UPI0039F06146